MRILLLTLVSFLFLSSCSVHVYHHHKGKNWKKGGVCEKCVEKLCKKCQEKLCHKCMKNKKCTDCNQCKECKEGKDCKTCESKSECSSGQCPLVKGKQSKKSCCNS